MNDLRKRAEEIENLIWYTNRGQKDADYVEKNREMLTNVLLSLQEDTIRRCAEKLNEAYHYGDQDQKYFKELILSLLDKAPLGGEEKA